MLKKMLLSLTFCTLPLLSVADELLINDDAPKTYIVEKGDTLWDISTVFLDQPWLWPKLWRLNPEIANPHLIYPGDVLTLVYDEQGEPMLIVKEPVVEVIPEPVVEAEETIVEPLPPVKKTIVVKEKPTYKWSPKIRESGKAKPINVLPLEVIAPYIRYENIFTQEQLAALPHVIGSDEGYKSSTDGFNIYVNDDLVIAKTYGIYQKGDEIVDPETEESLGFSAALVGTAQTIRIGDMANKKPATLFVNSANREIRAGSYIVPINEGQLLQANFTMRAASDEFRGAIIQSGSDLREFGKLEVVMINRGREHNVRAGDVMAIQRKSKSVVETENGPEYENEVSRFNQIGDIDYDMPEEKIGRIMVFKLYEKVSMAIILTTSKPARLEDAVTAP